MFLLPIFMIIYIQLYLATFLILSASYHQEQTSDGSQKSADH